MALSKGPVHQFLHACNIEIFKGLFSIVIDLGRAPAVYSAELYDTIASNMWSELCQQTEGPSHTVSTILPPQRRANGLYSSIGQSCT